MLELTHRTPWSALAGLHRDLNTVFSSVFGATFHLGRHAFAATPTPATGIWRDGDAWKVRLAIPGVTPDGIDINLMGRTLSVRGERTARRRPDSDPLFSELPHGQFERDFTLPDEIDTERVEATYRHGMLELTLPLKEAANPRRIPVYAVSDARQFATAV